MYALGLSRNDYRAYLAALRNSHRIKLDIRIRNRNEKPVSSLTAPVNRVLSGAVQVDTARDVTRSLELVLLDPNRKLRFEGGNPAVGALYADRFISVRYEVWVEELDEWISVPVFWGPVTSFTRNGPQVSVEAQGKETLMLEPHFATDGFTVGKRTRLDDAIKRVARQTGERRFSLPRLKHRLKRPVTVSARDEPWKVIAGGLEDRDGKKVTPLIERGKGNYSIFYDGRGRLTVRSRNRKPTFNFVEGRDLVALPSVSYDTSDFRNTVVVRGEKPKGKSRPSARATLPRHHPLSPSALGRNDKPRHMTEFVDTELKTERECLKRAEKVLSRLSDAGVEASFDVLPVPHLEEYDRVRLRTDDYDLEFRLKQFTIPLTSQESMSIGYNKSVSRFKRRRRPPGVAVGPKGGRGKGRV